MPKILMFFGLLHWQSIIGPHRWQTLPAGGLQLILA
jgi:hypothetical protein